MIIATLLIAAGSGFTPGALPPCAVEDASSGPTPCVWLASEFGNGVGHSFRVFKAVDPESGDHKFKYISDASARRLLGIGRND